MTLLDAYQQLLLGRRMSRNGGDWIRLSDDRNEYLLQVPTVFGLQEVIWNSSEEDRHADDWVVDFNHPPQTLLALMNTEGLRPVVGIPLPPGVVYAAGEPEYVGAFPLRQDLSILPEPNGGQLVLNSGSGAPPNSILTTVGSGQPTWQSVEGFTDLVIRPVEGEFHLTGSTNPGDLIFSVAGGMEMIRICGNGDFMVKGKLVENDKEVLQAFRKFLGYAGHMSLEPDPPDPNLKTRIQRALLNCVPEEDLVQSEEVL